MISPCSVLNLNLIRVRVLFTALIVIIILSPFALFGFLPCQTYAASITLEPDSGVTNESVAIHGVGFAGTLATIYWDDETVARNVAISESGEFLFNLNIPLDYRGDHIIQVADNSNWSGGSVSAT